jgi:hypothetical protein
MITCYDPELDRFADEIAGDFDYLSAAERESWLVQQWTEIAAAMGWSEALDDTLNGLRRCRMGFCDVSTEALAAFQQHADRQREGDVRTDRARIRDIALEHLFSKARPRSLWQVVISADSLPEGACFNLATWQSPPAHRGPRQPARGSNPLRTRPQRPQHRHPPQARVFGRRRPQLLRRRHPETAPIKNNGPLCGWNTPLRLSLGTFPWVYGHRLQSPAPALAWKSNATHQPAHRALQIASGFWQAEGNLRQDARDVVAHWKHWRSAVAGPLADNQSPAIRLEKQLLRVQGDEHTLGLNGPRGFISAAAFNYIQSRFAAFFAMRRALIRPVIASSPSCAPSPIRAPIPASRPGGPSRRSRGSTSCIDPSSAAAPTPSASIFCEL